MTKKKQYAVGLAYYQTHNKIETRKKLIFTEEGLIQDPYSANNKISSAFYQLLVDQKVDFLIGDAPTTPIESKTFYKDLQTGGKLASAQGVQWAYFYLQQGELKIEYFPTAELCWSFDRSGQLEWMKRVIVEDDDKTYIYLYDREGVRKYEADADGNTMGEPIETTGHYSTITTAGTEEIIESGSWGVVPFIPYYNNDRCIYDLEPIKSLIDVYDVVISDFANNLEDFQDVTWILKGYEGQDVSKFLDQVRRYKSIPVGEGGDARPETIEIPTEARMKMLEKLEDLIYSFGRGVNMAKLSGAQLTNVLIKAHFASLEMKANSFAYFTTQFINDYVEFYNLYAETFGKDTIETDFEVMYNKSMLINESEMLTANAQQTGFISKETRLGNHPWVDDVEQEMSNMGLVANIPANPVPMPNDGEEEQAFMERCMVVVMNEGTDQETAVSMCQRAWADGQEE